MSLPRAFRDLLLALNAEKVRYLVVGAHALAFHAEPRFTNDLDVWVEPTPANADRVWRALVRYGAPLGKVTRKDFTRPQQVFQLGIEPVRIDILMGIDGVQFHEAWPRRLRVELDGIPVAVLAKVDLIRAKKAAGRQLDQLDLKRLNRKVPRKAKPRGSKKRK